MMKRILVIGNCGAGKSTLSLRLAELLGLPLLHLDQIYWQPGWTEPETDEWQKRLEEALEMDTGIIDGNYATTLDIRLRWCDTVIFLDFKTLPCIWNILKRVSHSFGEVRPDMAPGCPERFDAEFLAYVWSFRRRQRSKVLEKLDRSARDRKKVILKNRLQVQEFVSRLEQRCTKGVVGGSC